MILGERRAAKPGGVADTGGVEGDHVLVTLAQQHVALGADGLHRLVQAVEDTSLVVRLAVVGVDVLCRSRPVRSPVPPGEARYLSPGGPYRKDKPPPEAPEALGGVGRADTYPEAGKGLTERRSAFLAALVPARHSLEGIVGKEGAGEGLVAA